ncbi:hypothetical protein GGX14DRAFT_646024 [Mycena pura]|uniref:Uncharacterized protein n=1 Tax=Mycena pura TaxID=153505 RepID=A0AAD6VEC2_9AGAR|nr:hypothetical protein GGX14DRAFT_646024 [Mycena pura]
MANNSPIMNCHLAASFEKQLRQLTRTRRRVHFFRRMTINNETAHLTDLLVRGAVRSSAHRARTPSHGEAAHRPESHIFSPFSGGQDAVWFPMSESEFDTALPTTVALAALAINHCNLRIYFTRLPLGNPPRAPFPVSRQARRTTRFRDRRISNTASPARFFLCILARRDPCVPEERSSNVTTSLFASGKFALRARCFRAWRKKEDIHVTHVICRRSVITNLALEAIIDGVDHLKTFDRVDHDAENQPCARWIRKCLAQKARLRRIARRVSGNSRMAFIKLCDDSFEEHAFGHDAAWPQHLTKKYRCSGRVLRRVGSQLRDFIQTASQRRRGARLHDRRGRFKREMWERSPAIRLPSKTEGKDKDGKGIIATREKVLAFLTTPDREALLAASKAGTVPRAHVAPADTPFGKTLIALGAILGCGSDDVRATRPARDVTTLLGTYDLVTANKCIYAPRLRCIALTSTTCSTSSRKLVAEDFVDKTEPLARAEVVDIAITWSAVDCRNRQGDGIEKARICGEQEEGKARQEPRKKKTKPPRYCALLPEVDLNRLLVDFVAKGLDAAALLGHLVKERRATRARTSRSCTQKAKARGQESRLSCQCAVGAWPLVRRRIIRGVVWNDRVMAVAVNRSHCGTARTYPRSTSTGYSWMCRKGPRRGCTPRPCGEGEARHARAHITLVHSRRQESRLSCHCAVGTWPSVRRLTSSAFFEGWFWNNRVMAVAVNRASELVLGL